MNGVTVDIWQIPLHTNVTEVIDPCLDAEERRRAAAFKFDRDRHRFTTAHAALRRVLAGYAGTAPASLIFDKTEDGKPFLAGSDWHFNLSHSEDLALLGVTRGRALGIDVERMRPLGRRRSPTPEASDDELMALAARHYSKAEVNHLGALADAARNRAFFCCWTRKEAYVKGIGTGILTDLREIEVGFEGGLAIGEWFVQSLRLHEPQAGDGFVAALAIHGLPAGPTEGVPTVSPAAARLLRYPQDLAAR